jgi:hypothetical protein
MPTTLNVRINVDSPINRKAIDDAAKNKWIKALAKAAPLIQKDMRQGLVMSGKYLTPFIETDLWQFLLLPSTIAELGFISLKPLYEDLLPSISDSSYIYAKHDKLYIGMVDMNFVATSTIHRSAGTGQLGELSWFVDWVINGVTVQDYEFVQTGPPIPRSSRIAGSEAGLMVYVRGGGFWKFPPIYKDSLDKWLQSNIEALKVIIGLRMAEVIRKRNT